jgi:hypothetical protein
MHATDRAVRRAALHAMVFAPQILRPILLQRNARLPALLRTPVDETVLADVAIPGACGTLPVIGPAFRSAWPRGHARESVRRWRRRPGATAVHLR